MKPLIILSLFLASCAAPRQYVQLRIKTVTYAQQSNTGTIVKLQDMRSKYYLPKKYAVGDTVKIYFVTAK